MEWRHSGSHYSQNIPSAKIRWKCSRLDYFLGGIKTASSSLIIFQRAKLSTRSITHLSCNLTTFWRKNATEMSWRKTCSCTKMPRLTGHLPPRQNWPPWASSVLITHPILIWPRRYHLFPGLKKKLKVRHFSSDVDVIAAAETLLDGQHSEFFWVAYKSYSN